MKLEKVIDVLENTQVFWIGLGVFTRIDDKEVLLETYPFIEETERTDILMQHAIHEKARRIMEIFE